MVEISASILDVKEEESAKTFYNLEVAKTDYFHIDVMDGKFVEKNTVDKMNKYTNILKQITILPLDVHLMVEDVETYVKLYKYFKEFKNYIKECEYVGCRHIKEESCGIKNALQRNEISESRYQNFIKIYEELKDREEHKW